MLGPPVPSPTIAPPAPIPSPTPSPLPVTKGSKVGEYLPYLILGGVLLVVLIALLGEEKPPKAG